MDLLYSITYAAYAKGTHHKLALDALQHLKCPASEAWQRLFLKHAKVFIEGSKAPDNSFKDFTNHVLHPRDGLWGGAPDATRTWYHHVTDALEKADWPTAVYSAGVLSHYYTDVLMPFHTGQSEAENNIHRAAEWSINRSYESLRELGEREWNVKPSLLQLPDTENWLAEMVVANARMANLSYEKLIAHYDIKRGVVDPPAGLDDVGRRIVAELLRFASLTFADVLARAFAEARVAPPDVSLTGPMLLAAAGIPANQLMKKIADIKERRLVQAMYDELLATGTVEKNLPEDDRIVRDQHAIEVLAKKPPLPATSKVFPFKPRGKSAVSQAPISQPAVNNVVPLRPHAMEAPAAAKPAQPERTPATALQDAAPAALADRVPPPLSQLKDIPTAEALPPFIMRQIPMPRPEPEPEPQKAPDAHPREIKAQGPEPTIARATTDDVVETPSGGKEPATDLKSEFATEAAFAPEPETMTTPLQEISTEPPPAAPAAELPQPEATHEPAIAARPFTLEPAHETAGHNTVREDETTTPVTTPITEIVTAPVTALNPPPPTPINPRSFLTIEHDVVDAPSIGPKTAERLYVCDVRTVRDLLAADPKALAEKLDVRHIDAQVLTDWQHQARLVCLVPGLRGTHAQLLVGAGYRTADALAAAEPEKLCADVLAFATSAEGQRVLRNGDPPDIEKIKGWLDLARSAQAA